MNWTRAADLRAQVQKLWEKGALLGAGLGAELGAEPLFPLRLRLAGPSSTELSSRFDDVRIWIAELRALEPRYRFVWREVRHRVVGANALPDEVWLDTLEQALAVVARQKDGRQFAALVRQTGDRHPELRPWLARNPLRALGLADAWSRLFDVVDWIRAHPHPGCYLRQIDIAGVDTKFIEAYRSVLTEWLDLTLPAEAIDASATGAAQFCRRYGFKDKPLRIRFRVLDASAALWATGTDQDIALTQTGFEQLALSISRVFVTENEVNFLAFPPMPGSMVVFGAGYGFEVLAAAPWLHGCSVYYWGDIDTHGFAILDQLRAHLPHVQSLLMDRATLLAHAAHWGDEPQPSLRDLPRLTAEESALFDALRDNRLRAGLRLEQERIGFGWVQQALATLPDASPDRGASHAKDPA